MEHLLTAWRLKGVRHDGSDLRAERPIPGEEAQHTHSRVPCSPADVQVIANVGDSKAILFRAATGGASSRDKYVTEGLDSGLRQWADPAADVWPCPGCLT